MCKQSIFHNVKDIVLEQTYQQARLLEAFGSAIQAGDKTFKASGEMGLRDIGIAEAVYHSAAKGGVSVAI